VTSKKSILSFWVFKIWKNTEEVIFIESLIYNKKIDQLFTNFLQLNQKLSIMMIASEHLWLVFASCYYFSLKTSRTLIIIESYL